MRYCSEGHPLSSSKHVEQKYKIKNKSLFFVCYTSLFIQTKPCIYMASFITSGRYKADHSQQDILKSCHCCDVEKPLLMAGPTDSN